MARLGRIAFAVKSFYLEGAGGYVQSYLFFRFTINLFLQESVNKCQPGSVVSCGERNEKMR